MRPRWPAFLKGHHRHALPPGLRDSQLRRPLAHHLAEAELAVDHRQRIVLKHRRELTICQHLARPQPVDIRLDADHPMRVVPDQVRLHQIMSDPFVLGRFHPAAAKISLTICLRRTCEMIMVPGSCVISN